MSRDRPDVLAQAAAVADELRTAGLRVRLDDREEHRPGFKFHEWELRGVPCRVEIGARDLAAGSVTVARRDTGARAAIALTGLGDELRTLLDDMQGSMFDAALEDQRRRTARPESYAEMIDYLRAASGFARAGWCGEAECEARVKRDSAATGSAASRSTRRPGRRIDASAAAGPPDPPPSGPRRTDLAPAASTDISISSRD